MVNFSTHCHPVHQRSRYLLAATEKIPNMAIVVFRDILREIVIQGSSGFEGGVTEGARRATGVTPPSARRNWLPPLPT